MDYYQENKHLFGKKKVNWPARIFRLLLAQIVFLFVVFLGLVGIGFTVRVAVDVLHIGYGSSLVNWTASMIQ